MDSYPGSAFFSQPDSSGNIYLIRDLRQDVSYTTEYTVSYIINTYAVRMHPRLWQIIEFPEVVVEFSLIIMIFFELI